MGFIRDEQDVIRMQVGLLRHIVGSIAENCAAEIEMLGAKLPAIGDTVPQVTFREAVRLVETGGHRLRRCRRCSTTSPRRPHVRRSWSPPTCDSPTS